ncbi:hypothetical protein Taro_022607 [Colocasia esculenta]|uniref:Uncharacterized protein n=1 Tax=Colocasia esculenta TaxID=4460 RepID=A0A843UUW6_COLES|nr:hypothetical protein [Colocasia esculenta]
MGARLASAPAVAAAYLCGFARVAADGFLRARLPPRPASRSSSSPRAARRGAGVADRSEAGRMAMERGADKVPLSEVVTDCLRRWFQDTLKEAKAGDVGMQVLVGQMYCSGYGVARNEQKVLIMLLGYNASDSDSDEVKDDTNLSGSKRDWLPTGPDMPHPHQKEMCTHNMNTVERSLGVDDIVAIWGSKLVPASAEHQGIEELRQLM